MLFQNVQKIRPGSLASNINDPVQRGKFRNLFQILLCNRKNLTLKFLTRTEGEGKKFQSQVFPVAEENLKIKPHEVKMQNF